MGSMNDSEKLTDIYKIVFEQVKEAGYEMVVKGPPPTNIHCLVETSVSNHCCFRASVIRMNPTGVSRVCETFDRDEAFAIALLLNGGVVPVVFSREEWADRDADFEISHSTGDDDR